MCMPSRSLQFVSLRFTSPPLCISFEYKRRTLWMCLSRREMYIHKTARRMKEKRVLPNWRKRRWRIRSKEQKKTTVIPVQDTWKFHVKRSIFGWKQMLFVWKKKIKICVRIKLFELVHKRKNNFKMSKRS